MSFKVGITGDIASGKSTVTDYLRNKGYTVVDADEISRSMTKDRSPVLDVIERQFPGVVCKGKLNRRKLGKIVFSDIHKRKELNAILHPLIREEISRQLTDGGDIVFLDAPLLFEGGYDDEMDVIIYITLDEDIQLKRLMNRDGITHQEARDRMRSFDMAKEEKMRRSHVIDNSTSREELLDQIDSFLLAHGIGKK
ncbi:MAG: dephospho-CoA kinase [Bacillota bacterium]|nr:dephospho-CoA kinase [Bacillota bacterium]